MTAAHVKRSADVLGAALLLVICIPLLFLVAALILLLDGPPLLYRQARVGRGGLPFTLLKFRTMRAGDPARYPDRPVAKLPGDPRVTPLGRWLRRLALDELPQLLNVLRGEMSLVGPRPLPQADLQQSGWLAHPDAAERARRQTWAERRRQVLPGLTGLWQISPRPAEDFDHWIERDLAYVARQSPWLDLAILLATPWAVLRGRQPAEPIAPKAPADETHRPT